jgi:hypothetical protein
MGKMTFIQLAETVLRDEKVPLSPGEIWKIAKKKKYDQDVDSKGKTPQNTLYSIILRELKVSNSSFVAVSIEPLIIYHKDVLSHEDAEKLLEKRLEKKKKEEPKFKEREIHSVLVNFAFHKFSAYTKTINHSTSPKTEFGQWLHPDIIGCHFIMEKDGGKLDDELAEFSKIAGNLPVKLFSFELKRYLDFTNLRDSFFQAVSNSSWSHEGYLVVPRQHFDEEDTTFLYELKRLSVSFGIGIILLDLEKFEDSEILYPAKPRENLNWETITKLAINADFKNLIKSITDSLHEKQIRPKDYDTIITSTELEKELEMLRSKK